MSRIQLTKQIGQAMHRVITSDNVDLYIKDWGKGKPVILLAGWPLSADSWDDQAIGLVEAGYRVISYDRRGFGRSSQPWTGYDYNTLADDLAAVIFQRGLEDVTLVGFSMGGGEVARYLSRHKGQHVSKVGLIASVVPYMLKTIDNPNGTEQAIFDKIDAAIKVDRAKFFTGFFKDFYGVSSISETVSDEVIDWSRSVAMQASLKATLECVKSFSSTDFRGDLSAFNMPTLIIHGTEDKTVPIAASARAAAKAIPHATLIEYDGSPHGLLASDKERITNDLLQFLKSE